MDLSEEHKNVLGAKLTRRLGEAVEKGYISVEQVSDVSAFILERIEQIKTREELMTFLEELDGKWPVFTFIRALEMAEDLKPIQASTGETPAIQDQHVTTNQVT